MGKELENLEDHDTPKVQDLAYEEKLIFSSFPFRQKTTVHCAGRIAKLFGNWIVHLLKL